MSLRLEMLQVARLSPNLLGESVDLIARFLSAQQLPGGGFTDRSGSPDIYYTVFGLESYLAIRAEAPLDLTVPYLESFGDGENLDFVHVACLARCWATVSRDSPRGEAILHRLETFRREDGGYSTGTTYAAFLALGAYEDFRLALPSPGELLHSLASLRSRDGAFSNQPGASVGLTTSTAAAVLLLRHLGVTPDPALAAWLLARAHPQGGFLALPDAPIPDLLSTATALHALSALHAPLHALREPCLDFVDSLWTNRGGFHGNWADDALDCEYTYYGLLSLGHLSL